jgi:hypothetical protein
MNHLAKTSFEKLNFDDETNLFHLNASYLKINLSVYPQKKMPTQ